MNPRNESVGDEVMKITGTGVHYSLETTSLPTVIRQAVDCLTPFSFLSAVQVFA